MRAQATRESIEPSARLCARLLTQGDTDVGRCSDISSTGVGECSDEVLKQLRTLDPMRSCQDMFADDAGRASDCAVWPLHRSAVTQKTTFSHKAKLDLCAQHKFSCQFSACSVRASAHTPPCVIKVPSLCSGPVLLRSTAPFKVRARVLFDRFFNPLFAHGRRRRGSIARYNVLLKDK